MSEFKAMEIVIKNYRGETVRLAAEEVERCPACGCEEFMKRFELTWRSAPLTYWLCLDCGALFLSPRMTETQSEVYYRDVYRDVAPDIPGRQEARARFWMAKLAHLLEGRRRSLEIGCSQGFLLRELAWKGITPEGVEPDARFRGMEPAKNYKTYASLRDVRRKRYDVMVMAHSLEHINQPYEFLTRLIEKHAESGCLMLIEVPNAAINRGLPGVHHPIGFNADSLTSLMEGVGCRAVQLWTHGLGGPMLDYLLGVYEVK